MKRQIFFAIFTAVLIFFTHPSASASGTDVVNSTVQWRDNRLSINVEDVPLDQLVSAIAGKTGLEIHGLNLLKGEVTANFSGLSLHEGLVTLLQGANYCLQEPSNVKDAHYVLSLISYAIPPGTNLRAHNPAAESNAFKIPASAGYVPEQYRKLYGFAAQGNMKALSQAISAGDTTAQTIGIKLVAKQDPDKATRLAITAAKSADSNQRLTAIQLLAELDNKRATEALGQALSDPDVGIRQAAVSGLYGQTSKNAVILLAEALQDSNESIRMQALDFLAGKGADGVAGINKALASEDPQLRDRAHELLEQVAAAE